MVAAAPPLGCGLLLPVGGARHLLGGAARMPVGTFGGAITAIESGYIRRGIQESSWAYQRAVDEGKKTIVGINRFQVEDGGPQMIFRANPETERAHLLYPIVEAVKVYGTLGEMCGVMRNVFGDYRAPTAV